MSSTTRSTCAGSSPSAITRISGSVPDLRMTRRPLPSSSASAAAIRLRTLSASSGLPAGEADVLEQLRQRLELVEQLARRRLGLDQRGEHLQRRDQAVAGRRMVGEDDVPRLLAADIVAARAHRLEHVAVADLGAQQLEAGLAEMPLEAEVRHHRRDDAVALELAAALQAERDQRHQLVAVDDLALLVDDDQPVGVAVERDADVGAARDHRLLQQLRVGRAAPRR